jgi:LacI family transcriptional regulator
MPATIRDLAKQLNLSITTVSRALDGYSDVSDRTRQRVIETAEQMGYQPTYAARQLRRKRADAIGYILPTSSPRFTDPFFSSFLAGLCDEAATHQIDIIVSSTPPESKNEQEMYRRWYSSRRVDGWVLNRTRVNDWRVGFLMENKVPFVALGCSSEADEFPAVVVDEREGFERLVAYLVSHNHQQIAFIGADPNLVIHRERFLGYKAGLEKAGIPYNAQLTATGNLTEEGGYIAALTLLSNATRPTAILGCNDLTALGVYRAAKEMGLVVGKDLAIAGYDGIKESEYTDPPLTTLYQPTYDIARRLAFMLTGMINGDEPVERRLNIKPELILRSSTG